MESPNKHDYSEFADLRAMANASELLSIAKRIEGVVGDDRGQLLDTLNLKALPYQGTFMWVYADEAHRTTPWGIQEVEDMTSEVAMRGSFLGFMDHLPSDDEDIDIRDHSIALKIHAGLANLSLHETNVTFENNLLLPVRAIQSVESDAEWNRMLCGRDFFDHTMTTEDLFQNLLDIIQDSCSQFGRSAVTDEAITQIEPWGINQSNTPQMLELLRRVAIVATVGFGVLQQELCYPNTVSSRVTDFRFMGYYLGIVNYPVKDRLHPHFTFEVYEGIQDSGVTSYRTELASPVLYVPISQNIELDIDLAG